MSRPCPVLATTDAFGWMSSNDSLVTTMSTPVAALKPFTIFMNASSSACTNRRQRIRLILAPFSGFHGAACAHALAQSVKAEADSVEAAASAVVPFNTVRRVRSCMGRFLCLQLRR